MTLLSLFGNSLITFGPILALYIVYIQSTPQLVLIAVASCITYILATFCTALFYILPFMQYVKFINAGLGLIFQEVFRFLFFWVYCKADAGFMHEGKRFSILKTKFGLVPAAIASGIGYATAQALMMHGTFLYQSLGPATYYSDACPSVPLVTLNSIIQAIFSVYHVAWMILAFEGYSKRSKTNFWRLLVLYGSRIVAVGLTLLFAVARNSCAFVLPLMIVLMIALLAVTFVQMYIAYGEPVNAEPQATQEVVVAQAPEQAE